ncbi:hypothetical protein N7495_003875 [Penicillium taxi]|uniref:uncharacterized protein n=1 Tax=Penicillium taxi TaxID=168475 RepID=UPI0025450126|nr:uncharacterized protein N7495_003875 [Penicillium taxi]KAJ5899131.1 hypothetical protein N7495_003875 [Penicillium taxi]
MDNSYTVFSQGSHLYSSIEQPQQESSMADVIVPSENGVSGDGYVPRPKRIACVVCRRRKLRCDGKRPSCGTCSRLGHECAFDEVRKKSGPKRGYVKQLEARLAQVETLLKGQESDLSQRTSPPQPQPQEHTFTDPVLDDSLLNLPDILGLGNGINASIPSLGEPQQNSAFFAQAPQIADGPRWDLIALGLEEPLPAQDVIDELEHTYFEKVHPMTPILHSPRYFASLNLGISSRPPICLRYIIWCHAASVSDKYFFLHQLFYQRARKYAEADEMKGFGERITTLSHCQTWTLIGVYEFRNIYFPRAWLSVGKACRLVLMMGFNRLDGSGVEVKQCLPPPKDWTEREERRRVFWMAFCSDRCASIGTGWPVVIDEQDIMTNLPSSEESFMKSKPQRTLRLSDIEEGEGVATLSPFACVAVLANLFGRNLIHIHRPHPLDNDQDLNGEFWKRHRSHDNILLHIALSLPEHLRLPSGMDDVNVVFANMSIHTSTICLHQAAIFKAEKNKMSNQIIMESKRRCLVAANQISNIMKMISHVDLSMLNPFMSFCLYVAARVFVQYLKSRPDDLTVYSSLQFVIGALNAMKAKNPLTESFLVQLDVDLEGTGLRAIDSSKPSSSAAIKEMIKNRDGCPSGIYTMRERQTDEAQIDTSPKNMRSSVNSHAPQAGMTTSLPSREKDSSIVDLEQNFYDGTSHQYFQAYKEGHSQGGIVDLEMDFSPDFKNPPSDHPTPSTLNSSSNTSYSLSGVDNPSPGNKQKLGSLNSNQVSATQSVHISPANTDSSRVSGIGYMSEQLYPTGGAAGATNIFSMQSAWDLPPQPPDMNTPDFNALSDAQWANILNNENDANLQNWRQS